MEETKNEVYTLSDDIVKKMVEETGKKYYDTGWNHGFAASQAINAFAVAGGLGLICAGLVGAGIAFIVDDICKEGSENGSKPVQRK